MLNVCSMRPKHEEDASAVPEPHSTDSPTTGIEAAASEARGETPVGDRPTRPDGITRGRMTTPEDPDDDAWPSRSPPQRSQQALDDDARTVVPSFDPAAFARAVDGGLQATSEQGSVSLRIGVEAIEDDVGDLEGGVTGLGRRMYQHYLESDFPAALELADLVLVRQDDHHLAHLVAERCRAVLGGRFDTPVLSGSSVIRPSEGVSDLRPFPMDSTSAVVLWHLDGVSSLDVIAEVSGIPPAATLGCLQALLELGVVEVVP